MKYLTLGESRNMIRFLKFVGLLEAEDSEILDCVIEHISLDQLRPDFQQWFEAPPYRDLATASLSQALSSDRSWDDSFSRCIDDRDEFSLYERSPRPTILRSQFIWGDYEALSYSWGEYNLDGRIRLNGAEICISRNLEAALRALRRLPKTRSGKRYWIDALCP
jgi:hypothetical protein